MQVEPDIAFRADTDGPGIVVRVNFGILAGREATAAEIDELALILRPDVDEVTIVSEIRHEIGRGSEAAVHQVRIDLADEYEHCVPTVVAAASFWAHMCANDRHPAI